MENGSEKTALKGASKMKMKHRQNKTKKTFITKQLKEELYIRCSISIYYTLYMCTKLQIVDIRSIECESQ